MKDSIGYLEIFNQKIPNELIVNQPSYLSSFELYTVILALFDSKDKTTKLFIIAAIKEFFSRTDAESLRFQMLFFRKNLLNANFFNGHETALIDILQTVQHNIHSLSSTSLYWLIGTLLIGKLLNMPKLAISYRAILNGSIVCRSFLSKLLKKDVIQALILCTHETSINSLKDWAFSYLSRTYSTKYYRDKAREILALIYPYLNSDEQQQVLTKILSKIKKGELNFAKELALIYPYASLTQQERILTIMFDELRKGRKLDNRSAVMDALAMIYFHATSIQQISILAHITAERKDVSAVMYKFDVKTLSLLYPYMNPAQQEAILPRIIALDGGDACHSGALLTLASLYSYVTLAQQEIIVDKIMARLNEGKIVHAEAMKALTLIYPYVNTERQAIIWTDIMTKLSYDEEKVRQGAVQALTLLYTQSNSDQQEIILTHIINKLDDSVEYVRQEAINAVASVYPYVKPEKRKGIFDRVISTLDNGEYIVCQEAITALGMLYPHVDLTQQESIFNRITSLRHDESIGQADVVSLILSCRSIYTKPVVTLFNSFSKETLKDIQAINQLCNDQLKQYIHSRENVALTTNHVSNINKTLTGTIYLPKEIAQKRLKKSLNGGNVTLLSDELVNVLQAKNDNGLSSIMQRVLTEFSLIYTVLYELDTDSLKAPNFLNDLKNKSRKEQYDAVLAHVNSNVILDLSRVQQTITLVEIYENQGFEALLARMIAFTHAEKKAIVAKVGMLNPLNYDTKDFTYSPYNMSDKPSVQKTISWNFYNKSKLAATTERCPKVAMIELQELKIKLK